MKNTRKSDHIVKKLLSYIRPHIAFIIAALICAVVQVVATLLAPVIIGKAVDCIIAENNVDFAKIAYYIILLSVSVAAVFLFQYMSSYFINIAS